MKRVLLFSFLIGALSAHAQSPGGVSGTNLWYKAAPVTSNLQGYYRWQDYSGDSVKLGQHRLTGSEVTEFTQSRTSLLTINFHPAFSLSEGVFGKSAYLEHSNLSQATIIGVFASLPNTSGQDMMLYAVNGREGSGTIFSKDKAVRVQGVEPLDYGSKYGEDLLFNSSDPITEDKFRERFPRIATYLKADRPNFGLWGEKTRTSISFGSTYSQTDTDFNTPFDASSFGNEEFDGYTPEYIVYSRYLSPLERRKVESYLAIKYGITLNGSYLDSEGNLIWDRDENQTYHNRVTAFGRDTGGGLLQPLSATSYEEAPTFSSLKENDSYHLSNSYNLPSASHLLVMGREYGNTMPEKGYVVWGDNDAATSTFTAPNDTLWHIMNRTWLVKTNIPASTDSLMTRWTGNGLDVTSKGFLDNITQAEAATDAYAITPAMPQGEGAIEFRCPLTHPTFDVGFTTGDNECTYGFRIGNNGYVYTISNGQTSSNTVATGVSGRMLSLCRENGYLFLRIDGKGNANCTLAMPDTVGVVRGIIRTLSAEVPLSIASVRTGGIGDTGNQAELSYGLTDEKKFADYCRRRTVMLIDPRGEGVFDPDNIITIKCSKPDIDRGKTVFHNIFWDADGSGSDMFTFAYYDGLDINAEPTPSTCENGLPRNDGSIDIGINIGTPIYNYTLTVDSVAGMEYGATVASGTFVNDTHRIDSLAPGSYTLSVTQGGGNDIYGTGDTSYQTGLYDIKSYMSGETAWTTAATNSNYRIGLGTAITENNILYGFDVKGGTAYVISSGYTASSPLASIKNGDILSLKTVNGQMTYSINGEAVHRETVWPARLWRLCIRFGTGETHITNLMTNGKPIETFTTSGNVQIETPNTHTVGLTVHVGSECDATLPNGTEDMRKRQNIELQKGNKATIDQSSLVVNERGNATRIFDAVLERDITSPATLIVFDASGKMMEHKDMRGDSVKNADFAVPGPGVYIIKALTEDGKEFTKKIIAK